ncbi:uncharacterized protein LOC117114697 [Anneissia japonica]|uniref:uncharacterized protein LOC117114697 n=1 Tax=Anneissia japonica TaxID=1529436 RepID=UPI001425B3D6|nr:uncharacterized protein LOC117114697 [Anneissia japonica]
MPNVLAFEGEKSATFKCDYRLKSNVDIQRWIKKTSKGNQVIYTSENLEKFKTKTEVQKYEADFDQKSAQLKINQVEVADAGVYSCEVVSKKLPTNTQRKKFANLVVPLDVFGSALVREKPHVYRHPAVVFADMHFFVFCEEQVAENYTKGLLRRGKLKEHSRIEWEPEQPILDMKNTRFENLVPIVVDEKKGDVILVCVERTAQQDCCKLVQLSSTDKKPWSGKADVNLKWPEDMQNGAEICFIGPGHGLCLQSGHLAVAGFFKFSEHVHLCMLISENKSETWEVVPIISSIIDSASFGNHAQIVEYAKNQVCITCSLANCQQRFNVFLKYKVYKDKLEPTLIKANPECQIVEYAKNQVCITTSLRKLEPTLIEANPGCQVGIVSIPDEKKGRFNFVAFTNPADKSHFKDLSVRLSKDGCETWTDPLYTLGRKFAKSSDLAYYKVKGFFTDDKGIACVYENINATDMNNNCYSIVMQLISLDEIKKH